MYFQNVRGLRTKLQLLFENVSYSQYHILVFNETSLTEDFRDSELQMFDYNIYRKDRSAETSACARGGGVLIAVRKNIASRVLPANNSIEHLFVQIDMSGEQFIFASAYFPPRSAFQKYVQFGESLERLSDEYPENKLCVLGDFNLPHSQWSKEDLASVAVPLPTAVPNEVESLQVLSFLCSYHNLYQVNSIANENNVILDLVFLQDRETRVFLADSALLPVDAHHPPLSFNIQCEFRHLNNGGLTGDGFYRDFHAMDIQAVLDFLSYFHWYSLFQNKCLDDMLSIFYDILYLTVEFFVPLKRYSAKKFPIWFSCELKEEIIKKKKAHKKYLISRSLRYYNEFSMIRANCKTLKKQCYHTYITLTESSLRVNIKNFWKYVNSRKGNSNIPAEMYYNNIRCASGGEIVNLFAEYFSEMYTDRNFNVSESVLSLGDVNLSHCSISLSAIYEKLSTLDINKGPGPDGIPPLLIRQCSFILARPLFSIFNLSLNSGIFPAFWKTSFITPILKSGDSSQVTNYRPISILSCIPKVFESFICDFLSSGLRGGFIDQQYGFLSQRSTELNLLTFTEFLLEALEEGCHVHAVYTDFTKAFDRVNHKILIQKLGVMGIHGSLLMWLRSYLSGRTQMVRVQGFKSFEIQVPSGVPQGSHLGPLLFNVYVNDISSCFVHSHFLMFADDLKFYTRVSGTDDCLHVQADLDRLTDWCDHNGMELNVNKCHLMVFSRGRSPIRQVYTINGCPLDVVCRIKDLGVTLDSQLSYIPHISLAISRSLRILGFIKRCTRDFLSIASIRVLFCSLVRPHLDYCSSVWSPHYDVHVQAIERVQHKFLRYISYKEHQGVDEINYTEIENSLNITTLQTRRMHRDLTMFYNLLHSNSFSPELTGRIGLRVPSRHTRQNHSFHVPPHRTNYGFNSYLSRAARLANQHSDRLDCFASQRIFKRQLISDL